MTTSFAGIQSDADVKEGAVDARDGPWDRATIGLCTATPRDYDAFEAPPDPCASTWA